MSKRPRSNSNLGSNKHLSVGKLESLHKMAEIKVSVSGKSLSRELIGVVLRVYGICSLEHYGKLTPQSLQTIISGNSRNAAAFLTGISESTIKRYAKLYWNTEEIPAEKQKKIPQAAPENTTNCS